MEGSESKLVDFLIEVGEASNLLRDYLADPEAVMTAAGLTPEEQQLILDGDFDAIREAVERRYPGRPITPPITGPFPIISPTGRFPITLAGEEDSSGQ